MDRAGSSSHYRGPRTQTHWPESQGSGTRQALSVVGCSRIVSRTPPAAPKHKATSTPSQHTPLTLPSVCRWKEPGKGHAHPPCPPGSPRGTRSWGDTGTGDRDLSSFQPARYLGTKIIFLRVHSPWKRSICSHTATRSMTSDTESFLANTWSEQLWPGPASVVGALTRLRSLPRHPSQASQVAPVMFCGWSPLSVRGEHPQYPAPVRHMNTC